jgi:hypothetical protein
VAQAVKAPSILLNRATRLIPSTFRYQTISPTLSMKRFSL